MVVEESVTEIFERTGVLEITVEKLARRLEEALTVLPQQQEIDYGNHHEL